VSVCARHYAQHYIISLPQPLVVLRLSTASPTSPTESTRLTNPFPHSDNMTVTIQLFYEPTKTMVGDFQVNSFETHDRIIKNIGNRLGVSFVAVYSQDAKAQIADLRDVIQGQILLVTNSPLTRPRPYSPYGFKFYRGEEVANVHPNLPKKPWAVSPREHSKK
jgi:hypothetical protein